MREVVTKICICNWCLVSGSFRGMLENAGAIVGQRSLQWDLSTIQPGLCLRIGPSPESTSMLEFVMDPRHDRGDRYINEEPPSTGTYDCFQCMRIECYQGCLCFIPAARSLAKQFVLPFLLGLKFNLITILPLFFGAIILLCKKAAFLGKMALFVTGLLGYGSAFSLGGLFGAGGLGGIGSGGGWPVAGGIGARPPFLNDVNVNVQADYPGYYKGYGEEYRRQEKKLTYPASTTSARPTGDVVADNFYDYEKNVMQQDRHAPNEYEQIDAELEATKGFRSFAWTTTT